MESTFAVGVKVKILGRFRDELKGQTGVIIKDAGFMNKIGTRKLGETWGKSCEKQWLVKLDNTGEESQFPEVTLEII